MAHLFSGSWGALAIIIRGLGIKYLIFGSWGSTVRMRFSNLFLASVGHDPQTPPILCILILPFNYSIILAKMKLAFRLVTASFSDSILAKDRKSFPKHFRDHA